MVMGALLDNVSVRTHLHRYAYSLTASVSGNGSVVLNPLVEPTIQRNGDLDRYFPIQVAFHRRSGDLDRICNPATITVNSNKTVTAGICARTLSTFNSRNQERQHITEPFREHMMPARW